MSLLPRGFFSDWQSDFDDTWRFLHIPVQPLRRLEREFENIQKHLTGDHMLEYENPYVTDESGNRRLQVRFDMQAYKPEEITVKTVDNKLVVQAKHVEEGPGRRNCSEFTRVLGLPEGMDLKQLKSKLTKEGVLQIDGPAPPAIEQPKESILPIEHL